MLSFYLFVTSLAALSVWFCVKYFFYREKLRLLEAGELVDSLNQEDNLEKLGLLIEEKLASAREWFNLKLKLHFHKGLNFLVVCVGWVAEKFDAVYVKMRDKLLATATKEKEVVIALWHHLKEYKKEKEEEKK